MPLTKSGASDQGERRVPSKAFASFIAAVALLLALTPTPSSSNSIDFPTLDAAVQAQMSKHGLPGVALAITQGDQIIYSKGYGTAGGGRPMTPQTPMYIGSQSKSFTALAIVQLAEAGKLDLNAPVREYIPWFTVADAEATQKITVYELLRHASGLSDSGYPVVLPDDATLEEGVRSLAAAQLTAPIGAKHQYFNMGYAALQMVVEQVSGQSYEAYLQQYIFAPLGMIHSTGDPAAARSMGLAQGYSRFFGFAAPARQPHRAYELGAGFLMSSAEDLARYAIAMNNEGAYSGGRVLSAEWMRKLFAPLYGYGMGWYVSGAGDHIWHGGANETFRTSVELYPRRGLGIVLLINEGYMQDHFISGPQLLGAVAAVALGNPPPVSLGWSVRTIGWGLLALVLGLCVLHGFNFRRLIGWRARARQMSPLKKAWEVAISFIIPTVILLVVYTQVKAFWGDRFNLGYQLSMLFSVLPDIGVLMIVGSAPDYAQGLIKLYWVLTGQTRRTAM
jgi:CubicO group peptidase (beta-lactamase class C family)